MCWTCSGHTQSILPRSLKLSKNQALSVYSELVKTVSRKFDCLVCQLDIPWTRCLFHSALVLLLWVLISWSRGCVRSGPLCVFSWSLLCVLFHVVCLVWTPVVYTTNCERCTHCEILFYIWLWPRAVHTHLDLFLDLWVSWLLRVSYWWRCCDCHVSHNECVMTAMCLIMIHAVSLTKHIVQYNGVCAILALQPVLFCWHSSLFVFAHKPFVSISL